MHRLHLLRHAKASRGDEGDDHQRKLSRRGRDEARRIGGRLPASLGRLDLVLCSTARRTRETAELVLACFAAPPRIRFEDRLYLADAGALLRLLRDLDEAEEAILVIGHNPGLHELAVALAALESPDYQALAGGKFPTGARAGLAVAGTWANLDLSRHALTDYVTPATLGD